MRCIRRRAAGKRSKPGRRAAAEEKRRKLWEEPAKWLARQPLAVRKPEGEKAVREAEDGFAEENIREADRVRSEDAWQALSAFTA